MKYHKLVEDPNRLTFLIDFKKSRFSSKFISRLIYKKMPNNRLKSIFTTRVKYRASSYKVQIFLASSDMLYFFFFIVNFYF